LHLSTSSVVDSKYEYGMIVIIKIIYVIKKATIKQKKFIAIAKWRQEWKE
jgi:hypothetical protein